MILKPKWYRPVSRRPVIFYHSNFVKLQNIDRVFHFYYSEKNNLTWPKWLSDILRFGSNTCRDYFIYSSLLIWDSFSLGTEAKTYAIECIKGFKYSVVKIMKTQAACEVYWGHSILRKEKKNRRKKSIRELQKYRWQNDQGTFFKKYFFLSNSNSKRSEPQSSDTEDEMRCRSIRAGLSLRDEGLSARTWGNISPEDNPGNYGHPS